MPAATAPSPRAQAVADLTGVIAFDEDGDPIVADDGYEGEVAAMPTREERRRFTDPVWYWEPLWPGCTLHPYPLLGEFRSEVSGVWGTQYPYQEAAVREHLRINVRVDPDTLRVTPEELAVMNGAESTTLKVRFCHAGACHFKSCSPVACDLHEELNGGHTTHNKPRKD
jgi:hypothetical protein